MLHQGNFVFLEQLCYCYRLFHVVNNWIYRSSVMIGLLEQLSTPYTVQLQRGIHACLYICCQLYHNTRGFLGFLWNEWLMNWSTVCFFFIKLPPPVHAFRRLFHLQGKTHLLQLRCYSQKRPISFGTVDEFFFQCNMIMVNKMVTVMSWI